MSDTDIYEKIGHLKSAIDAAHCRMDELNTNIRGLLEDVKKSLVKIEADYGTRLREVEAHVNQDKGGRAAAKWLIGTLLVVVGILCGLLAGKP